MSTATRRRSQPALGWASSSARVAREDLKILRLWHPNTLIDGQAEAALVVLAALHAVLRAPVVPWMAGESPALPPVPAGGTLVIRDVDRLSAAEQTQLVEWLSGRGGSIQVVAHAARPLLPLVERGDFDAALFYALNVIHLDVS